MSVEVRTSAEREGMSGEVVVSVEREGDECGGGGECNGVCRRKVVACIMVYSCVQKKKNHIR